MGEEVHISQSFPPNPKFKMYLLIMFLNSYLCPCCYLDSLLKNIPFEFWIFSSKSFNLKTQKAYMLGITARTTTYLLTPA